MVVGPILQGVGSILEGGSGLVTAINQVANPEIQQGQTEAAKLAAQAQIEAARAQREAEQQRARVAITAIMVGSGVITLIVLMVFLLRRGEQQAQYTSVE